jgi:hypothetical protein
VRKATVHENMREILPKTKMRVFRKIQGKQVAEINALQELRGDKKKNIEDDQVLNNFSNSSHS